MVAGAGFEPFRTKAMPLLAHLRCPTLRSLGAWRTCRPLRFVLLAVSPTGCARNPTPGTRRSSVRLITKEKSQPPKWETEIFWLRGPDLNRRPPGYEPDELPGCSTPRYIGHFLSALLLYTLCVFNASVFLIILKNII